MRDLRDSWSQLPNSSIEGAPAAAALRSLACPPPGEPQRRPGRTGAPASHLAEGAPVHGRRLRLASVVLAAVEMAREDTGTGADGRAALAKFKSAKSSLSKFKRAARLAAHTLHSESGHGDPDQSVGASSQSDSNLDSDSDSNSTISDSDSSTDSLQSHASAPPAVEPTDG